ncbi:PEPxxWA-CTERM sorting domain-containing protein [Sphingomonas sp.]|uniref:PEPxxWA-CTERM sorting domain-containing protein n=1 Tax=Sphingomonas sp. TaxID=28214 RepID=UPI002DB8BA52|nr:PEPxxWA-CTERM sorting domain-containing protein [Sphingomonas sp.]HEU4967577.1 PEPxxWA-CTERM sorting domain-containing protein [Sphingomonas sp.]
MRILMTAAAALLCTTAANATVTDDFNRPDALTIGDNYDVQNGNFRISGNKAITTNFVSLATYSNSTSVNAGLDASLRGVDAGSYVALSFGYGTANSYFVKVQDNNGDGFFDMYGFDTGNNDLNGPFLQLNPFQTGQIDVSVEGTVAKLSIFANGATQTYSFDYGYAPGDMRVGFGLNRLGAADNFRFDAVTGGSAVPEPAAWALMIGGFGLVGAAARRRRAAVAFA